MNASNERNSKWIGKSRFLFESLKWWNAYWGICAMGREEIVDVEYNKIELVELAWGKEIHLGVDLMKSQWRGVLWMTNQHQQSSFLKPESMPNYYQIIQWSILWSFHLQMWWTCNILLINWQDVNFQHQQTSPEDKRFLLSWCVVWWKHHHETTIFLNSILSAVLNIFSQYLSLQSYVSTSWYENAILHSIKPFPWKTSILQHLRPKCHVTTLYCANKTCHIKGGE